MRTQSLTLTAAIMVVAITCGYLVATGFTYSKYIPVAPAAGFALITVALVKPQWLFPVVGFLAPFVYAVSVAGAKVILADIVTGGLVMGWVVAYRRAELPPYALRVVRPFVALLGISLISLTVSSNITFGLTKIVQRTEYLLLFCVTALLLQDRRIIRRTMAAYVAVASVLAGIVVVSGFSQGIVHGPVTVLFLDKNGSGSFLAISTSMLITRLLVDRPSRWTPYLTLALLNATGLLLTGSRGAWLGVLVAIGVVATWNGRRMLMGYLTATLLLVVVLNALLPADITRSTEIGQLAVGGPATGTHGVNTVLVRAVEWRDALGIIVAHPILGVGVGAYLSYDTYEGDPLNFNTNDPHNSILYMWAELGPLGLVAFLWLLYSLWGLTTASIMDTAGSADHWVAVACRSALLTYFVFSLTEPLWIRGEGLIFFLLAGICASLTREEVTIRSLLTEVGSASPARAAAVR